MKEVSGVTLHSHSPHARQLHEHTPNKSLNRFYFLNKEQTALDVIFDMSPSFLCPIALFISVLLCPSYTLQ